MSKTIGLLLHEASALMRREFERAARPKKLTLMQWRVLARLSDQGDMRQAELGVAINASPMTISDVAERLECAGLLRRDPDPEDSRAKRLALTDAGLAKVLEMRTTAAQVFDKALDGIPEDDIAGLTRALTRLIQNLEGQ